MRTLYIKPAVLIAFLATFLPNILHSQTINGTIKDLDGNPRKATIELTQNGNTTSDLPPLKRSNSYLRIRDQKEGEYCNAKERSHRRRDHHQAA